MDQNSQNNVLTNNSRTAWSADILMPFLSSLNNLLQDAYIIFQTGVDSFEKEHKKSVEVRFGWGCSTPLRVEQFICCPKLKKGAFTPKSWGKVV